VLECALPTAHGWFARPSVERRLGRDELRRAIIVDRPVARLSNVRALSSPQARPMREAAALKEAEGKKNAKAV
jgi:hypothetical protein